VYARPDLLDTGSQVLARRDFVLGANGEQLAWNGLRADGGREYAQLDYTVIPGPVVPPAGGWWLADGGDPADVLAVWQPIGAADLDASYWRLDGLAGNINLDPVAVGAGVAPSFNSAKGWGFNGSSTYLSSGVTFSNLMLGAGTIVVRYSELSGGYPVVVGGGTVGNLIFVVPTQGAWQNGVSLGATLPQPDAAVVALAGQNVLVNGAPAVITNPLGAWLGSAPDNTIVDIGAWLDDGDFMSGYLACIAFYSTTKSDAAIAAISAAAGAL
jgi:hypothetical protein